MDYEFKLLALKYESLKELLNAVVDEFVKDESSKKIINKAIEIMDGGTE